MGSTSSLILTDIARKAVLRGPEKKITLNGIRQRSVFTSQIVSFEISPRLSQYERHSVEKAWTVRDLNLPKMDIDMPREKTKWPHYADINLPKVDGGLATLLLGADVFDLIVPLEVQPGPKGTPVPFVQLSDGRLVPTYLTQQRELKVHVSTRDEDLHTQVQEWWETESFGFKYDRKSLRSVEDEIAPKIFESTTKKLGYCDKIGLLWKHPTAKLLNNGLVTENHLRFLER